MHVGDVIRNHRIEANLTRKQLAVKIRIGENLLFQYENNEKVPDLQTILKISTVLDVPASEFLDHTEEFYNL
ncbi:helix-turn-helix domain-containing protein [Bacillus taeanensis]|uniref:XRE family transcriptional regulator n=1 Tax=Bacillus taeanensis TaxID=273032 RepID=A0A366XUH1_9BACI|nr:helix-turn-helix transcriptional regulator [Bacillus taeanensis]RBW69547.1 XRE family transcriptional regulator [Bacillus taeanensis]